MSKAKALRTSTALQCLSAITAMVRERDANKRARLAAGVIQGLHDLDSAVVNGAKLAQVVQEQDNILQAIRDSGFTLVAPGEGEPISIAMIEASKEEAEA